MLTRTFLRNLKTKAQHLHPIVIIGGNGLTDPVHNEIEIALNAHELVKIRVNAENREDRALMIEQIVEKSGAVMVQKIGHVLVLYRANQE